MVYVQILLVLPALHVEPLPEIAATVEKPDADHLEGLVARLLEDVSGEDAEPEDECGVHEHHDAAQQQVVDAPAEHGVDLEQVETNFVQIDVARLGLDQSEALALLRDAGVGLSSTIHPTVIRAVTHIDLTDEDKNIVAGRVAELRTAMDEQPKGTKWKLRARIGDKVKWYKEID